MIFLFISGCAGSNQLAELFTKDSLENKGLINLALAANGAKVTVSEDNTEHPSSALINGITSSEDWDKGEGWEVKLDGASITSFRNQDTVNPYDMYDIHSPMNDQLSYGIRIQASNGISAPLGWVIIEFPEKKTVNRMVVHTIDSEKYPAGKFGVSHLALQYWTEASLESEVTGWKIVDRVGNAKGQTGNIIRNNKSGVIPIRFEPVKTQRMRLAIWWTNDSKLKYNQYIIGAIRLIEVEAYGYESGKPRREKIASISSDDIEEIKVIIDTYICGYNEKNIDMLMSCISPEYSNNGEKCPELQKRIASVFKEYKQARLSLQNVEVKPADTETTATAVASYGLSTDDSGNTGTSGVVTFDFSKAAGVWKITCISIKEEM